MKLKTIDTKLPYDQRFKQHIEDARPYELLSTSLTQVTTGAPTKVDYFNSIGALVLTRVGVGDYRATLVGAFPAGKVPAQSGTIDRAAGSFWTANRIDNDTLQIRSYASGAVLTDGLFAGTFVEVKVFD